jgi:ribosome maturation factor RimP
MSIEEKVETTIQESLAARGYDIVRILKTDQTLQIMIERKDEVAINLEDCTRVHRMVSSLLDIHNVVKGHYALEISSAGIDRPLVRLDDYKRFKGHKIVLQTYDVFGERKKQRVIIQSIRESDIEFVREGATETEWLPFDKIKSACLHVE